MATMRIYDRRAVWTAGGPIMGTNLQSELIFNLIDWVSLSIEPQFWLTPSSLRRRNVAWCGPAAGAGAGGVVNRQRCAFIIRQTAR